MLNKGIDMATIVEVTGLAESIIQTLLIHKKEWIFAHAGRGL